MDNDVIDHDICACWCRYIVIRLTLGGQLQIEQDAQKKIYFMK